MHDLGPAGSLEVGGSVKRPRLLDLFCGAGGCAVGYHRAGFDVVGVDVEPHPDYPFDFVLGDAFDYLNSNGSKFDAIHASPPCQAFSTLGNCSPDLKAKYPDLLAECRELLAASSKPWVIENVVQAPFEYRSILCGLMFGLGVFRHRGFECSFLLMTPPHPSHRGKKVGKDGMCCVVGNSGGTSKAMRRNIAKYGTKQNPENWAKAMGIDWMVREDLTQAIPPAYTEFVGRQLLEQVRCKS